VDGGASYRLRVIGYGGTTDANDRRRTTDDGGRRTVDGGRTIAEGDTSALRVGMDSCLETANRR
jgi:hypothetical protein